MTSVLSPVALAGQQLIRAIALVPGLPAIAGIAVSVAPPTVVIGPPRLAWTAYNQGLPNTGQWQVFLVAALNTYALDTLLGFVSGVSEMVERHTQGVVLGAGPGIYPSPSGGLPAYIFTVALDF